METTIIAVKGYVGVYIGEYIIVHYTNMVRSPEGSVSP